MEERSSQGYYTPTQAAHILRVTPTRVRQLLQSGELEGERDAAGHWTIPAHVVHERLEDLRRESFLKAVGYDPSSGPEMRDVVEELREQVSYLREQLRREQHAHAEARRIIAGLVQRVPELEAPSPERPPERSEPDRADPQRGQPERVEPERPSTKEEEPPRRRSWWRKFFGIGE